jgi:hypothetical protein
MEYIKADVAVLKTVDHAHRIGYKIFTRNKIGI